MVRSLAVFSLAFAGLFVLAGGGWALLAGSVLALVLWPGGDMDTLLALKARGLVSLMSRLAQRVKGAPRRAGAITAMAAGVALLPFGFNAAAGLGAALIASAAVLIGGSVLLGWNA